MCSVCLGRADARSECGGCVLCHITTLRGVCDGGMHAARDTGARIRRHWPLRDAKKRGSGLDFPIWFR